MNPSNSPDPAKPLLVSIMLNIAGEGGHAYSYNLSVKTSIESIGWEHRAALQTGAAITHLPSGWEICLSPLYYRGSRPLLSGFIKAWRTVHQYLKKLAATEHRPIIVFLEFFSFTHLAALALALIDVRRNNISVWLVYRFDIHLHRTRILYKLCNAFIRLLVNRRLALFTDSDRLGASLSDYFHESITVLPIPHLGLTDPVRLPDRSTLPNRANKIICWWPGRPAEEKGLTTMQRIAQLTDAAAQHLTVVVAKDAQLKSTPAGCEIISIETELMRDEYLGWLQTTDIVLLPYDATKYAERTSGIFIESIVFGKPTFTTAGTWLASELQAANLSELIIDWNDPALLETIVRLGNDAEVKRKVIAMQQAYRQQHGEAAYARVMQRVFEQA